MKKLFAIILILAVLMTAVACNGDGGNTPDDTTTATPQDTTGGTPQDTTDPTDTTTGGDQGNTPEDPLDSFLKVDIDTVIYTADDEGVHLVGQHSGLYAKPDRATALDGGIADGTAVKVTAVLYEDKTDPTIGWAYITYGEDGTTAYIRISQIKCFVAPDPMTFDDILSLDRLISELSDIERAAVKKNVADMGFTMTVNADGTTTLSAKGYGSLTQRADKSWFEIDPDGMTCEYFGWWPSADKLTVFGLPTEATEYDVKLVGIAELYGLMVVFEDGMTLEAAKSFAEELKAVGYTVEALEAEQDGAYAYKASNSEGNLALIEYYDGQAALTVELTSDESDESFDLTSFMQSGENLHEYAEDEMEAFAEYIEENGGTVKTNDDGTISLLFDDGTATQYADGSWLLEVEGGSATYGSVWPDNEYTALVPEPTGLTLTASTLDIGMVGFAAIFDPETEISALRAYAEQLKAAGFTVDESVVDAQGVYMFSAANADGYAVTLANAEGNVVIMIASAEAE